MITLLLLFLSWFLIMWAAMTLAVSFYMVYGVIWIIAKIESRKIAKETDINSIIDSKFDEPETFSDAWKQGIERGKMKKEMKKQAKLDKKQAKLQAKKSKKETA